VIAAPVILAICVFISEVSANGGRRGLAVFLLYAPLAVIPLAAGLSLIVWWAVPWRQDWRWVVAAPWVMWLVLGAGALASGPSGSAAERATGWALVSALMYGAAGVLFSAGMSQRGRGLALVLLVVAPVAMVAYDDLSQSRWRRASYAATPHVLPVIPGYLPAAVRGWGTRLEVRMTGPVALEVWVVRCPDCAAGRDESDGVLSVVTAGHELTIGPVRDDDVATWAPPTDVAVRTADPDQLALLPLTPQLTSD
jgi:hypothetical protein